MTPRWESNGPNRVPEEATLLGREVVLKQGNHVWYGRLKMVRARTRGNMTLAVVGVGISPSSEGHKREIPIWTLRKRPFTIAPSPMRVSISRSPEFTEPETPWLVEYPDHGRWRTREFASFAEVLAALNGTDTAASS